MIVDDDDDVREITRLLLTAGGYQVITASDGVEALRNLDARPSPSLILLDLMMPRMDGEEFLKTLRGSPHASIPVIILTGHSAACQRAEALQASGCLIKPVDLDLLLDTVEKFIQR
jgi:CheY-like chemotaxis protein